MEYIISEYLIDDILKYLLHYIDDDNAVNYACKKYLTRTMSMLKPSMYHKDYYDIHHCKLKILFSKTLITIVG